MALTKKPEQRILELYTALNKRNKCVAKLYLDPSPPDPLHRHDRAYGNTFLHTAIRYRQFELVGLLLETLSGSLSNIKNDDGNTILHEMAADDDWGCMLERVVEKDPELLFARNNLGETPIFSAVRHDQVSMFRYLYREVEYRCSSEVEGVKKHLRRHDKTTILHVAITAEHFELAHYIVWRCEYLIAEKDEDGMTALQYLACNQKAFERKERRGEGFLDDRALKMRKDKSSRDKFIESEENKPHRTRLGLKELVRVLVENDPALRSIDSQAISSSEATEEECKSTEESEIGKSPEKNMQEPHVGNFPEEFKKNDESPLFLAIISNIPDIVEEIFLQYPSAIKSTNKDGMNVLQVAILYGNIGIFDLIINFDFVPDSLLSVTDSERNNLLHLVGQNQKGQADKRMQNPALQLRKECLFFQEVKAACNVHIKKPLNNRHQTAEELFADKNEKLHQKAKEWLMRTTENCTILSVFIATVAFAAAYTVPGGPDQNTGIPLLNSKPWFVVFIVADVISLTLALTSVGIFLSILTSSFPLQDFENSVFKKLRRGIITLVLSVSMMAVAFGATIVLTMTHNWEHVGWIVVGFLPVPIFFLSYTPLRSAVLGPVTELLTAIAAKFLHRCGERLDNFIECCPWPIYCCLRCLIDSYYFLAYHAGEAYSRICGQKSVERSKSRPPV